MQEDAGAAELPAIAVGFSPPDALGPVAEHLGWRGPFLSDERRELYGRLGWGRAPWWRVYAPRTLAIYARARREGHQSRTPVEDTRQLGGDAVVRDGIARVRWSPRRPDDRVDAAEMVSAARRIRDGA